MKSFFRHGRHKAFTLLEVIIAVAVLGVGLVMVASIFPVAATWTRQSTEETVASQVALNAVNIIKTKFAGTSVAWSASGHYPTGAVVVYNGRLYQTTANSYNNIPPATPWVEVSSTATQKVAGLSGMGTPISDYSGTQAYSPGAIVFSAGQLYMCKIAHTGQVVGNTTYWDNVGPFSLASVPKLFPLSERAYAFGAEKPFLLATPTTAKYFWSALARSTGTGNEFEVFIFVFRKGEADQSWALPYANEVSGARSGATNLEPTLVQRTYSDGAGTLDTGIQQITGAIPPVGYLGVGATSGTVFKQGLNANADAALANVSLVGGEDVIYAPASDQTVGSPLVYIYQTKLTF